MPDPGKTMALRVAIGILFAEVVAVTGAEMLDRAFPELFPWIHVSLMLTGIAGVLWAFAGEKISYIISYFKDKFTARKGEDRVITIKRRINRGWLYWIVVSFLFIIAFPWVASFVYWSVFVSTFIFYFFTVAGFDGKEAMDLAVRFLDTMTRIFVPETANELHHDGTRMETGQWQRSR